MDRDGNRDKDETNRVLRNNLYFAAPDGVRRPSNDDNNSDNESSDDGGENSNPRISRVPRDRRETKTPSYLPPGRSSTTINESNEGRHHQGVRGRVLGFIRARFGYI
jgi:hypothetical protein